MAGQQMAGRHLLFSNAQEQAREGGVTVPPEVVEDSVIKTTGGLPEKSG
jgi:glutathione-regulated potassium-efflux system protein KefB